MRCESGKLKPCTDLDFCSADLDFDFDSERQDQHAPHPLVCVLHASFGVQLTLLQVFCIATDQDGHERGPLDTNIRY